MNAGIYARVSVKHKNDRELSMEGQILLARQYLEKTKETWNRIEYFLDCGYSFIKSIIAGLCFHICEKLSGTDKLNGEGVFRWRKIHLTALSRRWQPVCL